VKRILLVTETSAFASAKAREGHDLLLALAAVEHQVSVLYRGAGVTQLAITATHGAPVKDFTKSQKLFTLYDIDAVYACTESLAFYHLTADVLNITVDTVAVAQQQQLLSQFDEVILC
jgi:tRNA 2-thiouridine synthesizing protein C